MFRTDRLARMLHYFVALVIFHLDTIMSTSTSEIKSLGCWRKGASGGDGISAISSLEGTSNPHLKELYYQRSDPILACAKAAASLGYNVFAVSNKGYTRGGECYSSCSAAKDFATHGDQNSRYCVGGTGGYTSMNVYSLDVTMYLGCIKNSQSGYVIPDLEGTHPALFKQPHERIHSIEKCGAIARSKGYNVFGVTKGGRCLGSGDAYTIFLKRINSQGPGKDCVEEKGNQYSISVHLTTGLVEFPAADTTSRRRGRHRARNRRV